MLHFVHLLPVFELFDDRLKHLVSPSPLDIALLLLPKRIKLYAAACAAGSSGTRFEILAFFPKNQYNYVKLAYPNPNRDKGGIPMKLVLLRHGESEWNRLNLFTGWTDVDLSEKGRQEAKYAGRLLKESGFDFDICYTSYLKRAIHTLNLALEEMDREWLPVIKTWLLNERHYGALQGLDKAQTARRYGEDQVKIWRRSFDVPPPALTETDPRSPRAQVQYRNEDKSLLPLAESLKDTIARVVPFYRDVIVPQMASGKRVLIAAHGNSLRALVKHFENLNEAQIMEVNIPTGVPLVYTLDSQFRIMGKEYLGDQELIQAKMESVANQGKAK
jgi:2,3-bisphosphoglycerate-dependent phosphoglycerate mutase